MIDHSIVAGLRFGGFPSYHMGDAEIIGEVMWSGKPNGSRVSTSDLIKARERFLTSPNAGMLPLVPPIPDEYIQKAIFEGPGADPTSLASSQDDYDQKMEPLKKAMARDAERYQDDLAKSICAELPEGNEIRKALTAASSNLMHVIADQDVTYLYKRPYPVQALIPTEANKGKTANFDIVGPYDFGSAGFGTEDQSFTETDITTYNRSQVIKYLYAVGRVTKAAQLAGLAQIPARDVLAIRIDAAQDALRALRERALLGVTTDVTSTTNTFRSAVIATDQTYNGLHQIITGNADATGSKCWLASTGGTYAGIMADLDTSYRTMVKFAMQPNLAICDYRTFGIIRRGLMEYFRTEPVMKFTQGISKINLVFPNADGLPLVPHPFMPMGAALGTIMLVDTRLFARRSLWQDMYEELAKINLSQKFVISAAETLVDKSDVSGTFVTAATATESLHGGVFTIA
jgi:hypothetical protein